jgi:hypothetical protein
MGCIQPLCNESLHLPYFTANKHYSCNEKIQERKNAREGRILSAPLHLSGPRAAFVFAGISALADRGTLDAGRQVGGVPADGALTPARVEGSVAGSPAAGPTRWDSAERLRAQSRGGRSAPSGFKVTTAKSQGACGSIGQLALRSSAPQTEFH